MVGAIASISLAPHNAIAAWIDAATGQPVHVNPEWKDNPRPLNPNQSYYGGHNLVWDNSCNTWRDAKTFDEVHVNPEWKDNPRPLNPNQSYYGGHNLVWVPCPPPSTAASSGLYLGGELVKSWGLVRSTEKLATTGAVTNQFTDSADPIGGGIIIGYTFAPWANNIVASAFASFDFLHAPVNHTFPGGSFLGSTATFMGTAGVKIGPQLDIGLWLYGIAGVSVLNETLNVNFLPVASSQSAWVAGGTLGVGGAWQPSFLQGFGRPVSLFLEYQHTWWQDATFSTPAASPAFNYTFHRQDDVVKFGFTVSLNAPPPPPPVRPLITK
jgi:hypothetical protein